MRFILLLFAVIFGPGSTDGQGTTETMGTSSMLDVIKDLKVLTMSKANVESVNAKLTSVLDGTASVGTANKMTGEVFLTKVDDFVELVTDDMFSSTMRMETLDITSASVEIASANIISSLTSLQSSLTTLITNIEEAIEEKQKQAEMISGSTASTFQIVTGTMEGTLETAANGELDKLRNLSKIIYKSRKVVSKMNETLSDSEATEPTTQINDTNEEEATEYEAASDIFTMDCSEYVRLLPLDLSSMRVIKMGLSILSMKVTLTAEDTTVIETLRTDLETEMEKLEQLVILIRGSFLSVTDNIIYTDVQLLTGRLDGTAIDAINEGIQELGDVKKNQNACKEVVSRLESVIAGTATEGVEISYLDFRSLVFSFIEMTSMDVLDSTIVSASTGVTIAIVTDLTLQEIDAINVQKDSLNNLIVQLSTLKALTEEFIMFFSPVPISDIEVAAGFVGADIDSAKTKILLELKALTMSSRAIETISAKIESASNGEATTGTEVSGEEFINMVSELVSINPPNFLHDEAITSMALDIDMSKVTLTADQVNNLSFLMKEIDVLATRVEAQISMVQATFKSIVGMEASLADILAAGSSCCARKQVNGHIYTYIMSTDDTSKYNCLDDCVYEKEHMPGYARDMSGSRYCFARGSFEPECLK